MNSIAGDHTTAAGLYVHIPFCEAKCAYCHFAIDPRRPDPDRERRYVRAVLEEMRTVARDESSGVAYGPCDTLYFGGGTPSLLRAESLVALLDAARALFRLRDDAEITLEANPSDLDYEGYARLDALGVNRLSLGVQSFDDEVLRQMGRMHTARHAREAVEQARQAGVMNLSVDLILGWPGETRARWQHNLDAVADMTPDHVSLYVLEVEPKTRLAHELRRGTRDVPDDDVVADLYGDTVEFLASRGLARYEISNFARAGFASRHNGKYWDDSPFMGFGMSAHSYSAPRRWWNHPTFGAYCRAIETEGGAAARAGERLLSHRQRFEEALFTGLRRREGIDLATFRFHYGIDPIEEYRDAFDRAFEAQVAEVIDGALRLTERGVLVSNEVFAALV